MKHILVRDISVIPFQFADDKTLYLDGKKEEESFTETVNVHERFVSVSVLRWQ